MGRSREAQIRAALNELGAAFNRGGYIRSPNPERWKMESWRYYKKGYETRFLVDDPAELAELRTLIKRAGFHLVRPFRKHRRLVQPVYGRTSMELILAAAGVTPPISDP